MLFLLLTQGDGRKIRVNVKRADAYYAPKADDIPKECKGTKTVIEVDETAYYVKETEEEIDFAVSNAASPLRVVKTSGWGNATAQA